MVELVILDMDGLLIDTEPYWQETERKLFSEYGIFLTVEDQHATFGLRTDEQIKYWYNYKPWKNPDFKAVEKRYNEIIKSYFEKDAGLMEGAEYIIEYFTRKKIPLALASSSNMELINTFVDRFRFRDKFKLLYSAEYEEFGKPHPAVYISTAKKLGFHPSSCLAFEDSLHGVVSAKAAKMKVVAVPDKAHFDLRGYGISDLKISSLKVFNDELFQKIISP